MTAKTLKRIGLGLLAAFAVFLLGDFIPSLFPFSSIELPVVGEFFYWQALEGAILMFAAAFAGAYVAKVSFVGPAVLFAVSIWAISIHLLYATAAPVGQVELANLIAKSIPSLVLVVSVAAFGALFGSSFARKREGNDVIAA